MKLLGIMFTSILLFQKNMIKTLSITKNLGFNLNQRFLSMKREKSVLGKFEHPFYKPKTPNQKVYDDYLKNDQVKIVFVVGPAGTGKTMLACNHAIQQLKKGEIKKIILTRPVVPVEEDIGFLPGNINKKMDPWTRPIIDIFLEFFSQKEVDTMIQNGIIEISPLAYMRGRTFKNAFIIADEMQNSSPNQMLMLTTRFGKDSKMIITGDLKQSDKGMMSGLYDFMMRFKNYRSTMFIDFISGDIKSMDTGIKLVEMSMDDIERDPVVAKILEIYETPSKPNDVEVAKNSSTMHRDYSADLLS